MILGSTLEVLFVMCATMPNDPSSATMARGARGSQSRYRSRPAGVEDPDSVGIRCSVWLGRVSIKLSLIGNVAGNKRPCLKVSQLGNLFCSEAVHLDLSILNQGPDLMAIFRVTHSKWLHMDSPDYNLIPHPLQLDTAVGNRAIANVEPVVGVNVNVDELSFVHKSINGLVPTLFNELLHACVKRSNKCSASHLTHSIACVVRPRCHTFLD